MRLARAIVVGLLACCGYGPASATENGETLYVLHCSGCHGVRGTAKDIGRIPPLAGSVGHFMRSPQARVFLTQAPGIMNSGLSDGDITALMNWLVPALAEGSLAEPFKPYTVDEISRSRANRPPDFFVARRKLAAELKAQGLELPVY